MMIMGVGVEQSSTIHHFSVLFLERERERPNMAAYLTTLHQQYLILNTGIVSHELTCLTWFTLRIKCLILIISY